MMQWLAGGVVVLGCGYIGLVLASFLDHRIRQMEDMERFFQQLAFNIGFLSMPFAKAVSQAAHTQSGAVAELFCHMAEELERYPQQTLQEAWAKGKEKTRGLYLKEPETETVLAFLYRAGKGDYKETLDGIHLTVAKLKSLRESALQRQQRDGKMYRGLGFLVGMLIVVLLL